MSSSRLAPRGSNADEGDYAGRDGGSAAVPPSASDVSGSNGDGREDSGRNAGSPAMLPSDIGLSRFGSRTSDADAGSSAFEKHDADRGAGSAAGLVSSPASSRSGGLGSRYSCRDAGSVAVSSTSSRSSDFRGRHPGRGAGSSGSRDAGKIHRGRAARPTAVPPSQATSSGSYGSRSQDRDAGSDVSLSASASDASEVAFETRGARDSRAGSQPTSSASGDAANTNMLAGNPLWLSPTYVLQMGETVIMFLISCIAVLAALAVVIMVVRRRQLGATLVWQELREADDDDEPCGRSPRRANQETHCAVRPHFRLLSSPLPCTQVVLDHRDGREDEELRDDDPSRPQIVAL